MSSGNEFQIPLLINNAENIANMDVELQFDPEVVEVLSVTPGSLVQDALFDYNMGEDKIKFAFISSDGISGNGSLALITFKVVGVPGNETTIIISAGGNDVDDKPVDFEIGNGIFRVSSPEEVRGDCNGDGRIDSLDALIALEMAVGKRNVSEVADINRDGRVNSYDAKKINDLGVKKTADMIFNTFRGVHPGIKSHKVVDYRLGKNEG
jgi:hypothetical protein